MYCWSMEYLPCNRYTGLADYRVSWCNNRRVYHFLYNNRCVDQFNVITGVHISFGAITVTVLVSS